MATPSDAEIRRRFFLHFALALVTLGLYMPLWIAWWDREVRIRVPAGVGPPSAWAIGSGAALALIARPMFGTSSPGLAAALSLVAIGLFLTGIHQTTRTLERALDRLDFDTPATPGVALLVMGAAFVGVELGNTFETPFVRAPVVLVVLALPYVFWRLHVGFEVVRFAAPSR